MTGLTMRHDVERRIHMGALLGCHSAAMIATVFSAFLLWGTAPAAAQEDSFTETLFTSLGLMPPPQADIEYRERAPLVVPPSSADILPPPRDGSEMANNPAWPKDPDHEARKKAAADAKKPVYVSDRQNTRALTPNEVANGRRAGSSLHTTPVQSGAPARDNWIQPRNLEFLGWGSQKKAPLAFEGEPERQALSEPPPGYQTPAPGAAYGVVAERPEEKRWSLPSWFDRTQSSNDRH
jgi:hypothetical protein